MNIAQADVRVAKQSTLPDFSGRFFSQSLYGLDNPYSGFSFTVGVPLFGLGNYKSKIRAATLEQDYRQTMFEYEQQTFNSQVQQAIQTLDKSRQMLQYYEISGLKQAGDIIKVATLSYRGGEISFAELAQYLNQALDIRKNYLDALNQYNQKSCRN